MSINLIVPSTLRDARGELRRAFAARLEQLQKPAFIRARWAVAYAFPGLHRDGYEEPESGWPRVLEPFAAGARRRAKAGELGDDELYACDAQWAGLYDRMHTHTTAETARCLRIAADYSEHADA
jgi:hypothetical protein